jgi:hypothetical protein
MPNPVGPNRTLCGTSPRTGGGAVGSAESVFLSARNEAAIARGRLCTLTDLTDQATGTAKSGSLTTMAGPHQGAQQKATP